MVDIDLGVDPSEVVNKAAQYDPNLIQRVIAEMQRDKLIKHIEDAEKHISGEVNTED